MATMPELIAVLEAHHVDSGATLELFGRRLREAGRITKGKRGRGAAQMMGLDASRMLIACAATDHPERAVDAEYEFSNTVFSSRQVNSNVGFDLDPEFFEPTLDMAVARLLEALADGSIDAATDKRAQASRVRPFPVAGVRIGFIRGSVSAVIQVNGSEWHYHHAAAAALVSAPDYATQQPLRDGYDRETRRFRTGKNLIATIEEPLLRALAALIAKGIPGNNV